MSEYAFNKVEFAYDSEADAFPPIDPGVTPLGSRVLVQLRSSKRKTKGGIILTGETRETEQWNTQVAKVRAVGPVAFHNRNTLEPWPEGAWFKEGDYVRCPKYGGDRWSITSEDGDEVIFVMFNDLDVGGRVDGDPLAMKAFI